MRILTGVAASLVVLALTTPGATRPSPPVVTTDVDTVPVHAVTQVRTLPPPAVDAHRNQGPRKPLLMRDGLTARQLKELMRRGRLRIPGHGRIAIDTTPPPGSPGPIGGVVVGQFEGLANVDNDAVYGAALGILPPDTNLGVGPDHVFQVVNIVGRTSDKTGGVPTTFDLNSFFALDFLYSESDPKMIYDAASARWFGTYLEFADFSPFFADSSIMLAVSQTSDPTGSFCIYKLGNPTSETFLQDFPQLGVSDDKVVVSYNGFQFPLTVEVFIGAGYYVLNKADLTSCAPLRATRVAPDPTLNTAEPVQNLSASNDAFLVSHTGSGDATLTLLTVSGVPGISPVTVSRASLPINPWSIAPGAEQAGSSVLIETNDERVVTAAWQNGSLWLGGNEACTPPGDTAVRACLRLIEVDTTAGSIAQDITYATVGGHYYYPALRPDAAGNLHVVFTASSASAFPGVRVTGRLVDDPVGTLQPSTELRAGGGAQTDPSGRWGDYQGAAVDPSDPSSVWVHGEYVRSTAASDWGTFVARLQIAGTPTPVDLTVTAVTNPPATAFTGDVFTVTDTTANIGTADAPAPTTTRYYLSLDTTKSASDVLLSGSRAVPALAVGAVSSGSAVLTIPSTTAPATYFLLACADDTSVIVESDETNNCRSSASTIQVSPAPPDLVVSSVDDPPTTALVGATFRVTDITQNVGTVSAPASTTRYYLSLDALRDSADLLLGGSRAIPALAAGASSTDTVTVTVPTGTPAATYFLLACADDLNVVIETNETNNCRASVHTVQVSLPTADLAVTAVSDPPAAAVPGSSFVVTDTTQNVGPTVVGASTTGYVLSLDPVRSADDIVIGSRGLGALGAGVPSTGSAPVTIPLGTPTGVYFLLACADDPNQIVEANEANNCRAAAGTVSVASPTADLVVTALSNPPASVAATGSFSVTDTTQNIGTTGTAPATTTRYYLSTNTVLDAGDVLLGGVRAVPSLAAGASSAGTVTVTVPSSTAVGVYFLLGCADDTNQVPETNETNNCRASATTVQVTPASADLVVTSVDDPPATALSGGSFRVTDITKNVGAVTAAASTTRYYLSLDTVRDGSDVLLTGARAIPSLAPGAVSTDTVTVTVPGGTSAGTYFLLACADDLNVVAETNETNNCTASVHTVQLSLPTADLAVTAVSDPPAAAVPGASFVVTDTTQNVGPTSVAASTTGYVLSLDTVRSADDIVVGSRGLGALGAGVPSTGSATATIPTTTPFGTYFLLACADDTNQIVEANEANNCRVAAGTVVVAPPTADLVVTALSNPPSSAATSSSFSVTDTTQNAGTTGTAPATTTRYYLSTNTVLDAGDVLLGGVRAVPALAAGVSSTGTVTVTVPATTTAGGYFLLACADDTNQVPETNEGNNCRASTTTVQIILGGADLTVTSVDDPPATALSGGSFRVTDITANVGAGSAAASTTRYYLSLDTVRDAADVLLVGSRAIPALAPNTSSTATVTVTVRSGTPAGTYFLLACADDLGVVVESNETNNCAASIHTTVLSLPTADLAVTAVSDPPAAAVPGTSFIITDTTQNVGPTAVSASTTAYVLSLDTVRSADDIVVGSRGIGALGPGVPSTGSATATIPATTPFGTYFLLACADDTSQIVEANEANNCRAAAGSVVVAPPTADLVVTAVTNPPSTAAASSSFSVTDTTGNAGASGSAPASSTRYYLSTNTLRDAGDVLLSGARAVPALAAGASSSGTATVTIPATTAVGAYFLLACADDTAQVPETNESNNCNASVTTIQVTPATADLAVTGLDDPPATALSGASIRVTDITKNVGVVSAAASTTRYYLSLDAVRDASDVLLSGARAVSALAPGAFSTDTVTVTIPAGTASGTYFLLGCADDLGVVSESNETNNCLASVGTVRLSLPTADLAVTAVSDPPSAAGLGASFVVTDTTQNVGPTVVGASTTRYVLSLDGVRSADDIVIGVRGVGALGPGVPSTGSAVVTIPTTTPTGRYFLLACGDDTNQILEVNEANNCRAAAGTVKIHP